MTKKMTNSDYSWKRVSHEAGMIVTLPPFYGEMSAGHHQNFTGLPRILRGGPSYLHSLLVHIRSRSRLE
jgi:hypothetical protein